MLTGDPNKINAKGRSVKGRKTYLFIYYQFLSMTGSHKRYKPVQGASPQKLHTTYNCTKQTTTKTKKHTHKQ